MKTSIKLTAFAILALVGYISCGGDSYCSSIYNRLDIIAKFQSFEKVINVLNQTVTLIIDEVSLVTALSIPDVISKTNERLAIITSAFSNAGLSFPVNTIASATVSLVSGSYFFASPKDKQLISIDFIANQSVIISRSVERLFLEELAKIFDSSYDALKAVYDDPNQPTSILVSCFVYNMQYLKRLESSILTGIAQKAAESRALVEASFN